MSLSTKTFLVLKHQPLFCYHQCLNKIYKETDTEDIKTFKMWMPNLIEMLNLGKSIKTIKFLHNSDKTVSGFNFPHLLGKSENNIDMS